MDSGVGGPTTVSRENEIPREREKERERRGRGEGGIPRVLLGRQRQVVCMPGGSRAQNTSRCRVQHITLKGKVQGVRCGEKGAGSRD